jgi:hypothetical protein
MYRFSGSVGFIDPTAQLTSSLQSLINESRMAVDTARAEISKTGQNLTGTTQLLNQTLLSANRTLDTANKLGTSTTQLVTQANARLSSIAKTQEEVEKAAIESQSSMATLKVMSVVIGVAAVGGLYLYAKRR